MKSIDICYKNSCELEEQGIEDSIHVKIEGNLTDIMSKPLPATAHHKLCLSMNLRSEGPHQHGQTRDYTD
jgi:hypothetical protein